MMMSPILNAFENDHPNIDLQKIYMEIDPKKATAYKIKGVPQFVLLRNNEEIKRHAGPMTKQELEKFINIG